MSRKSPLTALAALMVVASCAGPTLVMAQDVAWPDRSVAFSGTGSPATPACRIAVHREIDAEADEAGWNGCVRIRCQAETGAAGPTQGRLTEMAALRVFGCDHAGPQGTVRIGQAGQNGESPGKPGVRVTHLRSPHPLHAAGQAVATDILNLGVPGVHQGTVAGGQGFVDGRAGDRQLEDVQQVASALGRTRNTDFKGAAVAQFAGELGGAAADRNA